LNRYYSKENIEMARSLTSLVIKTMLIKTTMRFHFIAIRTATVKREMITSVSEDVEKLQPSYTAGGNVTWYSYFGKQLVSSLRH
jgi:hypothetical protein